MTETRKRYSVICEGANVPIFSQPWWLDCTAGQEGWDVRILEENGNWLAALPFVKKRFGPFQAIKMPGLTPWIHILFNYPPDSNAQARLAFEKDALSKLIPALPRVHYFNQKYSTEYRNWLPFYWHHFRQTTRYTYRFTDLTDMDAIYAGLKKNTRYDIRRAAKHVFIDESDDFERFLNINKLTFQRQNKKASYSDDFVRSLDSACFERKCRKILIASDREDHDHAGVYVVEDDCMVYYLMGGGNPEYRNSGANSLLIWEAIQYAASQGKGFDFEGSMIESIEHFFRSFGAMPDPYFAISKSRFPFNVVEKFR